MDTAGSGRECSCSAPRMSNSNGLVSPEDQSSIPTTSPIVQLLHQRHAKDDMNTDLPTFTHSGRARQSTAVRQKLLYAGQIILFGTILVQFVMLYRKYAIATACSLVDAGELKKQHVGEASSTSSSDLPQYYQTKPELWPGPTPTGEPAFLAQTNPAPFGSTTYIPVQPLETQTPISGNTANGNIFQMMGELSHYFPNPDGFGVDEYHLPKGAEIVQLHMLSRHGARYPTTGSGALMLAEKILNYTANLSRGDGNFSGALNFLNSWSSKLGAEILVPIGKQELFDSGTLHQYMYGHLYPNNGSKIVVRSTTQDRMTQSAEYFLAGFFGLDWPSNATLVLAIESTGIWNNSLAGYKNCNNTRQSTGGTNASAEWCKIYLADATARLNDLSPVDFTWTVEDAHNAQSLCAYETVALGYSAFCSLFTYEEWEGYEYSVDLTFAGNNAFQSPTGRAVGIGYVQEILARMEHRLITTPVAQVNVTLDSQPDTFPLHQALNFDFSHDTNIMSILTAFGFTQFAQLMPADNFTNNRSLVVSHLEPFAARLDIELITTPLPLDGDRKSGDRYIHDEGDERASEGNQRKETTYVHFLLNQRTLPLGRSFPACGQRDDGWCELSTFLQVQAESLDAARYEYACFGEYPAYKYGEVLDGAPP